MDSRDPGEAYRRAEGLERSGQRHEAERIYRRLLETHPDHPAVLHNLAQLLRRNGAPREAELLLRRGIEKEPREPALYNALGAVLRASGRLADAEAAYLKALELSPAYAEAHYNLGIVYEEAGRRDDALSAYRKAVTLQPDFGKALTRIGASLMQQGAPESALPYLENAVAAAPDSFDALYYKGWALSSLGQHAASLDALERARSLRPDSFEAILATANSLREAGRNDEALAAYWKLLELRPERAATHEDLNKLAWMARRRDLYLKSFGYTRERLGERPDLLHMEAAFHFRGDDFPAAERLLRRAHEQTPQRGDVAGLLARTLAAQGKLDDSIPLFAAAVRAEPQVMLHRQELGFTLLRAGRPRDAMTVFEEARVAAPADQMILAGLTLAYRQADDSRYHGLVDFRRFVRVYDLPAPAGFADVDGFNRALALELDALHTTTAEPIDQTLRGGTQTMGQLFQRKSRAIQELVGHVNAAVEDYIRGLGAGDPHPVSTARRAAYRYAGSWSCRLASGGYHRNHVHPQGWISSAYYARLPDALGEGARNDGWLKFGESNLALGDRDVPDFFVKPRVGRMVLFPSFYWHGTVPFAGAADRLAISFDVAPDPTGP